MSKNIHNRHGENIHKMEQIPEKPVSTAAPDLSIESRGSRSPAEIKRITSKAEKRHSKKTSNRTHT